MKTGIEMIAEERKRQVEVEGWTTEHDDQHRDGELAIAAACYAIPQRTQRLLEVVRKSLRGLPGWSPSAWPFNEGSWKPTPEDRVSELAKSGALIASEIDRLLRDQKRTEDGNCDIDRKTAGDYR